MRSTGPVTQREHLPPEGATLVSCTDLRSHITYCNPSFCEVSGYRADELLGQPHNLIRHPDMPAEAFRDMWATLQAGLPWTGLVKNRRKNGDHYWVRANVTPVREAGRVNGYMSVRTLPSRQEVAEAEALYARMRQDAAQGPLRLRLHLGELRHSGWRGAWDRVRRPSLSVRIAALSLLSTLLASSTGAALSGAGLWAELALALLLGGALAAVQRRLTVAPLRQATEVARRMSSGDLSQRIPSTRQDEAGALMRGLNQLNVNLQALVGDIQREVDGVSQATREISTGNQDLGHRTETQASNLQQTASSVAQITSTVQQTAGHTHSAAGLARSAADMAERSGRAAGELAERMDEIRSSSARIGEIVGTIDGISFQTNILALNAAVEAARAGEAGRGFAVVAAEVRALAQRTTAAAREIKALIEDSGHKVASGNALVQATGEATRQTQEAVQRVHALITEISDATESQSQGAAEVHQALTALDGLTQQNAAMVEQLAAAASQLNSRAEVMARAVCVFQA